MNTFFAHQKTCNSVKEWINQTSDNEYTEKFDLPLHYQDNVLEDTDINKIFLK